MSAVAGRDLHGRTVVITGGDTGLGLETTKALATTGASVIIGAYNGTSGAAVAQQVAQSSGNPNIHALAVDLSSTASVRAFAAAVLAEHDTLDALINDAGIDHSPVSLPPMTEDGFERVFQVNYLGPFLLTELLLPALRKSLGGGKVINVASEGSFSACAWRNAAPGCIAAMEQWRTVATTTNGSLAPAAGPCGPVTPSGCNAVGTPSSNYGVTKFAQVAHAQELTNREAAAGIGAAQGSTVHAYSLHPGFVATPMTAPLAPATARAWCKPLPLKPGVCPITVQAGAATQAFLASAPQEELEAGAYYVLCAPQPKANASGWDWSQGSSASAFFDFSHAMLHPSPLAAA
eukprot:g647.t1